MPIQSERRQTAGFRVTYSAPFELMWLLYNGEADHVLEGRFASTEAVRLEFGPALRAFWADHVRGFTEMLVLAERSGTLLEPDMRGFFAGIERAATSTAATPSLLSETPAERSAVGRMVRTPGGFFGECHVVELDGWMYLGRGIQPHGDTADQRHVAKHVSKTLKAFADPTRLAILMWLARKPASVTEISRHFKLAQPTISAHIHLLREAGVLEDKPSGRSSLLSVREQSVRDVLGGA